MELLFQKNEERCRMEIYSEYLRKIPKLLLQLEAVEKMYQKALLEDEMLQKKDHENPSVEKYQNRIDQIQTQCLERMEDLRQECSLIMRLKCQLEEESPALRWLKQEACKGLAISKKVWYSSNVVKITTWKREYLGVAQLVARYLGVVEAVGSSPVTQTRRSILFGMLRIFLCKFDRVVHDWE